MTLRDFATVVLSSARAVPSYNRPDDKRVWIDDAYEASRGLLSRRQYPDREAWERELWLACQGGLLLLARCDLVQAFPIAKVKSSDMNVLGCTFNYIRV